MPKATRVDQLPTELVIEDAGHNLLHLRLKDRQSLQHMNPIRLGSCLNTGHNPATMNAPYYTCEQALQIADKLLEMVAYLRSKEEL